MDPRLFILLFVITVFVVYFVGLYFYIQLLRSTLELVGQENRTLEPSFIWIEFFPFIGPCWNILISYQIVISIRNKIKVLPIKRSILLLWGFGLTHSFILASSVIAFFFIPAISLVLFPIAIVLMLLWVWQLISVRKFIESQRVQN
ncbi:MAG: hypothetical protein HRU38_12875 [Saccharospirillaceae bacterium]|nr:hypothetical protein [Pseudomonadales bacterium]NRB79537.1 hypothetical protein [Saccharospirillaceae bacterium]